MRLYNIESNNVKLIEIKNLSKHQKGPIDYQTMGCQDIQNNENDV